MLSPKQIKSKLENVIDQAHESRRFFVNPDSNFTRKGKCEFKKLISAMLVMEGGTLRDVIQRFFGADAKSTPTVSALVQARKKLTDDLFPSLFLMLHECHQQVFHQFFHVFHEYQSDYLK